MKVQEITTPEGPRYLLLDDDYRVIDPVKRFLKHLDVCGKAPNTLLAFSRDLCIYFTYLRDRGIAYSDVGKKEYGGPVAIIDGFIEWYKHPQIASGIIPFHGEAPARSSRTINRVVSTVLSFYSFLASNKELQELEVYRKMRTSPHFIGFLSELQRKRESGKSNIFHQVEETHDVVGITRNEYRQLWDACMTRRDQAMLGLMFECGIRLGELRGLRLSDLREIGAEKVFLCSRDNVNGARVKRHSDRTVFPPPYVVQTLIAYITGDIADIDSDYLFVTLTGPARGRPLSESAVEKLFERLRKRVGFYVTPHMLRHGYAEERLLAGWQMVDIRAMLGHKNIQSTDIYAKYTDMDELGKIARAFYNDHADRYTGFQHK